MDRAIAAGAEDRVTDTVQRLTGRPPRTFRAFREREMLRRQRAQVPKTAADAKSADVVFGDAVG
jgi:hypothetical protein